VTIAVEQVEDSIKLDNFIVDKNKRYALVLGNEVKGVQQTVVDFCKMSLEIPQ
jgi:tRNA G18 (ribose-2'-O)-methylase SpoU